MVRATLWTVGLFGAGTTICRVFPGAWTEPVVLIALGLAFLFVSARIGVPQRRTQPAASATTAVREGGAPAPLAAPAPVERTA